MVSWVLDYISSDIGDHIEKITFNSELHIGFPLEYQIRFVQSFPIHFPLKFDWNDQRSQTSDGPSPLNLCLTCTDIWKSTSDPGSWNRGDLLLDDDESSLMRTITMMWIMRWGMPSPTNIAMFYIVQRAFDPLPPRFERFVWLTINQKGLK